MNILTTQVSLKYKTFEIYIAGCKAKPHCKNCHNPESWDFNQGIKFDVNYFKQRIAFKLQLFNDLIDNIWILGGEPLDQDLQELRFLLKLLYSYDKKIWLWTRFEINQIPYFIKELCHFIKTGRYYENNKVNNYEVCGIKLASKNQRIWKNIGGGNFELIK